MIEYELPTKQKQTITKTTKHKKNRKHYNTQQLNKIKERQWQQ